MNNREAVNWLINISADIGKAKHSDLWHYEQALTEIKDMLESAQQEQTKMIKEIRKWIDSGNRGSADYFIVDKIEEIIDEYD